MFNYNNYRKLKELNLYTLEYWYVKEDGNVRYYSITFMGIAGFYNAMDDMKQSLKRFSEKLITCKIEKAYIAC